MTDKLKHLAEYLNAIGNGADARLVHDAALQIEMLKREIRIGKEINDALQDRLNNRDLETIHTFNKRKAIEKLESGLKLTHSSFTKNEYVYLSGIDIMTEDGYYFTHEFFNQQDPLWDEGWSVWAE